MDQVKLDHIQFLEDEINLHLAKGDFLKLPKLTEKLSDEIKNLTFSIEDKSQLTSNDLKILERINSTIKFFEAETFRQFQKYTGKRSKQAKMHNAYKKYGF